MHLVWRQRRARGLTLALFASCSFRFVRRLSGRFPLSLSTLTTFNNDDLTRTFLSVNVGAGYPEVSLSPYTRRVSSSFSPSPFSLCRSNYILNFSSTHLITQLQNLTERLNTLLTSLHLPPYYKTPLFHTSIAWALLEPRTTVKPASSTSSSTTKSTPELSTSATRALTEPPTSESNKTTTDFPRVARIPPSLLDSLEEEFGAAMRKESYWTVREMRMRSGGVVTRFPFGR